MTDRGPGRQSDAADGHTTTAGGLIDVHAHFTTESYIRAAKAAGHVDPDGMPEDYWPQWSATEHLDLMDRTGVGRAMLSISSPGVHFGDDHEAARLATEVNDAGATIVRTYPHRFGLFASLPLPSVELTLSELQRVYEELDAAGVIVLSNNRGVYLGDRRLEPVLAELDRRHAIVLLHPTTPAGHEAVTSGRPRPMIEFLFDTARAVLDFVLSGYAERFPNIRLVVPHMGGVLPLLVDRVELFRSIGAGLGIDAGAADVHTVGEMVGRFHYDLAGAANAAQLGALLTMAEPDRLLYGSDFAWTRSSVAERALATLDEISADDWRARTTGNAERLFDNSGRSRSGAPRT